MAYRELGRRKYGWLIHQLAKVLPINTKNPGLTAGICLYLAIVTGLVHCDGVFLQQGHWVVGQLAGAQARVSGVVLPVDKGHALPGKLLGKLGHQHLVAALIVPVGLLDVGKQGIADDLSQ